MLLICDKGAPNLNITRKMDMFDVKSVYLFIARLLNCGSLFLENVQCDNVVQVTSSVRLQLET